MAFLDFIIREIGIARQAVHFILAHVGQRQQRELPKDLPPELVSQVGSLFLVSDNMAVEPSNQNERSRYDFRRTELPNYGCRRQLMQTTPRDEADGGNAPLAIYLSDTGSLEYRLIKKSFEGGELDEAYRSAIWRQVAACSWDGKVWDGKVGDGKVKAGKGEV